MIFFWAAPPPLARGGRTNELLPQLGGGNNDRDVTEAFPPPVLENPLAIINPPVPPGPPITFVVFSDGLVRWKNEEPESPPAPPIVITGAPTCLAVMLALA